MTDIATREDARDEKRELALLKAVGFDRVPPEQRELAINIANRYGLDLLLRHIVMVDGRPYVTRDALLHIAHRSGQFDGIETTTPEIVGDEWRATATVWRKDWSHPVTYSGRYPVKGGNNTRYAPEMAIKVAESMALRRAFNVAAPVVEERWDLEAPEATEPPVKQTLAEVVASKAAAVTTADEEVPETGSSAVLTSFDTTSMPPRLTPAEFRRWWGERPEAEFQRVARALFPDQPSGLPLDDWQRAKLKIFVEAEEEAPTEELGLA